MTKRLRLTVAHNGSADLVPRLAQYDSVESVFAKMPNDLIGGGRSSYLLAEVGNGQLKTFIEQAHACNKKFIYLLNATCLGNLEMTRSFNAQLLGFISSLVDMGVDGFVVSLPYVVDLIKRHFPSVKVSVSTFAIIDSVRKAKVWESRGADRLIVQQDLNRNFPLLKKIRQSVSCEIELFANNMCVHQCPYPPFHAAQNAHSSASHDATKGFCLDYYGYNCALRRLQNPDEFIRGRFIRPEDLHLYEDIGINVFKLSDRIKSTDWIVNVVKAYENRRYDGNLFDLIAYPYMAGEKDVVLSDPVKWLLRPDYVHMETLDKLETMARGNTIIQIDNRQLDGFIEHFTKHDCTDFVCDVDCRHCSRYAQKALRVDREKANERMKYLKQVIEMLTDRSAFAEEPLIKRASIKTVHMAATMFNLGRKQNGRSEQGRV